MALVYFKRYRMEIELPRRDGGSSLPPTGYLFVSWDRGLLETHARVKYESFREEIDANVFPCFGEYGGCLRLMNEIAQKPGFLPEATWLAVHEGGAGKPRQPCGTIQGVRDRSGIGSIQNLGIVPEHRNRGVGSGLLRRALDGFWQAGLDRVSLEVTAENEGAIRLYHRLGFRIVKTVFKATEVACT